jgi:putative ABC transport system permease protein
MRLSNVVRLYRVRLRSRFVQEGFAVSGIAIGVALLFASQVASTSLSGSVREVTAGIVGQMRFQLVARAPQGFDQRLLGDVDRLPGVSQALPVLEARADVLGPSGARTVDRSCAGSPTRHWSACGRSRCPSRSPRRSA